MNKSLCGKNVCLCVCGWPDTSYVFVIKYICLTTSPMIPTLLNKNAINWRIYSFNFFAQDCLYLLCCLRTDLLRSILMRLDLNQSPPKDTPKCHLVIHSSLLYNWKKIHIINTLYKRYLSVKISKQLKLIKLCVIVKILIWGKMLNTSSICP